MKSLKKLLSIFAAFMMVVGLTMTNASADGYSITINDALKGSTYKAYKLFDASYPEGDVTADSAVAYSTTSESFNALPENVRNLFTTTNGTTGKLNVTTTHSAEEITSAIRTAISEGNWNLTVAGEITPTVDGPATISLREPGYYYVTSTTGSLIGVTTTNQNPSIDEKNDKPNITKTAPELGNDLTANVGKVINFNLTVTVQPGATNYVVNDVMSSGLTYKGNLTVNPETALDSSNNDNILNKDGQTLTINFDQDWLDNISQVTTVTITYDAMINENAIVTNKVTNEATLDYGTNMDSSHKPNSKVEIYTYGFGIMKTKEDDSLLDGAVFEIMNAKDEKISLVEDTATIDGKEVKFFRPAKPGETGETEFTAGNVQIRGLANGKYTLKEVSAPAGYKILVTNPTVVINSNNNFVITDDNGSYKEGGIQVINEVGTSLPSTGGMGTTMLYVVGGILMVGAAILFVTNKRMKHN